MAPQDVVSGWIAGVVCIRVQGIRVQCRVPQSWQNLAKQPLCQQLQVMGLQGCPCPPPDKEPIDPPRGRGTASCRLCQGICTHSFPALIHTPRQAQDPLC